MLRKKLLTVAGIIGILACGACFLPPITDRQPTAPPAPRAPNLAGIHTMRVIVTDNSIPAHLDTDAAAAELVRSINLAESQRGITAHAGGDPADADLNITIHFDAATFIRKWAQDGSESWSFSFNFSESLVRADGQVLAKRFDVPVAVPRTLPPKHGEEVWKESQVMETCIQSLTAKSMQGVFF